jgi:glycosyltransferase involved in cell wall biosynthesis
MLRHYDQHEGGIKVYTKNLLFHLLSIDTKNSYVFMYQHPKLIGTYADYPNVEEIVFRIPSSILWDQIAVPWIAKNKKVDIIFNPKLTTPLFGRQKKVFVIHGAEWFVIPETFLWYDRWYFKNFIPLYYRHADKYISVSETVKKDIVKYTHIDPNKVTPIYHGFDSNLFQVVHDQDHLLSVKKRYQLPDQFILWTGQLYPPKNFGRLLRGYAAVKDEIPHQLVVAGELRWKAKGDIQLIEDLDIKDRVQFAGWVFHDDLPAFYNLAELFVLPSLYEGFGIPLIEAMACGCPVLTSTTASPPEVVNGSAYLVDPLQVNEIANGIREVLSNIELRKEMIQKGLDRTKFFSWEKCAAEVLAVLESL